MKYMCWFIFTASIFFLNGRAALAAVTMSQSEAVFGPEGIFMSTWTFTAEQGKERREQLSDSAKLRYSDPIMQVVITRPDIGKEWLFYPHWKKYAEEVIRISTWQVTNNAVEISTIPTLSRIGENIIRIESKIQGPGEVISISGQSCKPYTFSMDWISTPIKSDKEARRYRYREHACIGEGGDPLMREFISNTSTTAPKPMPSSPRHVQHEKRSAFADMFLALAIEPQFFEIDKEKFLNHIPGIRLRRRWTLTKIQQGHEVSFEQQERNVAHRDKNVSAVPWNLPGFEASVGASILLYGFQSLTIRHHNIPSWVLDVDPEFPKHGGIAISQEFLGIKVDSRPGLFELPKGYEKVEQKSKIVLP